MVTVRGNIRVKVGYRVWVGTEGGLSVGLGYCYG